MKKINKAPILITAIISIKVQEPQFEGQTKTKLGNSEVMGAVDQAVSSLLANYLEENPKDARTIVNDVRENVNFSFLPINEFAIKPYFSFTETHKTLLGPTILIINIYPSNSNKKKLKINPLPYYCQDNNKES